MYEEYEEVEEAATASDAVLEASDYLFVIHSYLSSFQCLCKPVLKFVLFFNIYHLDLV